MLKLDNNLLDELGLGGLPADQKQTMLQHIYDTLELRVGTRLANQMTDQQLDEFERFIDTGGDANQAQALQWLETNLPNYKEVVNQVFEELKAEIKQMAPQIMTASTPAGQQTAVTQSTQQPAVADQPAHQVPQHHQAQPYTHTPSAGTAQSGPQTTSVNQPDPAGYWTPSQQPAQPQQPAQDGQGQGMGGRQIYQFPTQQPPAGPGGHQDQRAT